MKLLAIFLTALLITSCSTVPVANNATSSPTPANTPAAAAANNSAAESAVQFLLTSAASDFHDHGPKGPLQFRNVRVGHVTASDGNNQYMLCGEILKTAEGDKAEWTKFATIKTSGYEQYIGDNVYCQKPNAVWDTEGDISSRLQNQLDALQSKEKPGGK